MSQETFARSVARSSLFRVRHFPLTCSICFVALLFLAMANVAFGAETNTAQGCKISDEDSAGLNGDEATDIHAIPEYEDTVRQMLNAGNFEALDCLADRARRQKEKFSGGFWKIHLLYAGLSDPVPSPLHATQKDWDGLLASLQQWMSARPQSITARAALASAYLSYAWFARGNGTAGTVSDSGWDLFGERVAKARQLLEDADQLPDKCPEWFVAMQTVALAQGWKIDEARALFDKAVRFEPHYYYYSGQFAEYLLPKWYGENGDTEKFVQEVADREGGEAGDALYFQISNFTLCGCGDEPHLSTPRIVKGFDASENLYGPSMLNLNLIAKMGAYTSDLNAVDAASEAFTRIGDQWDEATWKTQEQFNSVKKSITEYAPQAAKELVEDRTAEANAKTSEGMRYAIAFGKTYRKLVEQCTDEIGNHFNNIQTLTNVGVDGTIIDMSVVSDGPINVCVFQKLQGFRQRKTSVFPAPPHAPYWIRLDLTKADVSPVAEK